MTEKTRNITVKIERTNNGVVYLSIKPFDSNVIDVVKKNPGRIAFLRDERLWAFNAEYLPNLQEEFKKLENINFAFDGIES